MTPRQFFTDAITRWEGGWQALPADSGNYTPAGKLVGTMRGVTVLTFARYAHLDPETVTPALMRETITADYAAGIYEELYFDEPKIAWLEWSPLAGQVADFGWGSGPGTAIRELQRMLGVADDGNIGPLTVAAAESYVAGHGLAAANDDLAMLRRRFYLDISAPGSGREQFRAGWLNRADWYLSANPTWWASWKDWQPQKSSAAPADAGNATAAA